jgi:hypothetical protein
MIIEGNENDETRWSAVAVNRLIEGRTSQAEVEFLVDSAPHQLLMVGKKLALYDGCDLMAEGEIIQML